MQVRTELRNQVARTLDQQAGSIVQDAVPVFPFAGAGLANGEAGTRLATLLVRLLREAALEGGLDARSGLVAELHQVATENALQIGQVFGVAYVVERAALDELALDQSFGATSEPWPSIAQMVRRSSFDVLAAYAERLSHEPGERALVDPLTTLHTRPVLVAALEKEIQRAERFGHPFALILVDVDRLADINANHGYGSGDRVLERLGILMRNYFREQDWAARMSGDAFAVLLPETPREHARDLAERLRGTVEERLAIHDYRSEQEVPVTISVVVVSAESVGASLRAEPLLEDARQAMHRAKFGGRNRVEAMEIVLPPAAPPPRDNPLVG